MGHLFGDICGTFRDLVLCWPFWGHLMRFEGPYRVPLGTSEAFGGPIRHLWKTVEGEHLGDH